jgi:hypothetical protein
MIVTFKNEREKALYSSEKALTLKFGKRMAEKIGQRIGDLEAADNPQHLPKSARFHEHIGNGTLDTPVCFRGKNNNYIIMKRLIALIPTYGKTKDQVIAEVIRQCELKKADPEKPDPREAPEVSPPSEVRPPILS